MYQASSLPCIFPAFLFSCPPLLSPFAHQEPSCLGRDEEYVIGWREAERPGALANPSEAVDRSRRRTLKIGPRTQARVPLRIFHKRETVRRLTAVSRGVHDSVSRDSTRDSCLSS